MCGYNLRDNLDPVYTANGTYSTHLFADKVIDIVNKHQGDKVKSLNNILGIKIGFKSFLKAA